MYIYILELDKTVQDKNKDVLEKNINQKLIIVDIITN